MPTPYGSRGGVAFSADELRVLRGALAVALRSSPDSAPAAREMLQLAEALDEAEREGYRLRSFVLADLARYRAALPGSAAGYLGLLEDALTAGYLPRAEDLRALAALAGAPSGPAEAGRRRALLERCGRLAEQAARSGLLALPGGRWCTPELGEEKPGKPAEEPGEPGRKEPGKKPAQEPGEEPRKPSPSRRPVPTPGEVFPPRRRPAPPPEEALPA
ncbi:hypothetical protein [Streptomyces sp. TR06-5]|uniref:hypothetical protein n=1 Tax=Streptomyces sp. TR06-5 TaxID=3385976 RepID=UPI0039A2C3B7